MSKGIRIVLVFAMMAGLFAFAPVHVAQAQNTQFPAYTSSIAISNLDPSKAATVVLVGYNADGSKSGSELTDTIPVNGFKNYFPISNVANGFSGSFVISADVRVAAISNIVESNFVAAAAYVGRSGGATKVLLPTLFKNNSGYYTWFSVQNAGTGVATIDIDYSDNGVGKDIVGKQIPQSAAMVFYQASENHSQKIFAATVTSDKPIVVAVIQENPHIMFAYTGIDPSIPNLNPVLPTINANNANYQTGVQIQNGGASPTVVRVDYSPANGIGTACSETQTIQPGASNLFALRAFKLDDTLNGTVENCANGVRFLGSGRVAANSAGMPLVAVVNQLGLVDGEAYNAFNATDPSEVGSSVVMPLIMDRNSSFFTGFNIQNVGSVPTTVNCTFTNTGYSFSAQLQPGQAANDLQNNKIADRYIGSGTCTSNPATAIVAVVNELRQQANTDGLLVYEGIKK